MEDKTFTILSFTRDDLRRFLSEEQFAPLTDHDLEQIASELRQIYTLEMSLTEVLESYTKFYLVFKK
jgi:hypothetical protein